MGEPAAGIGFNGFAIGAGGSKTRDIAGDFEFVGRGNEDDAVKAAAPIDEYALLFAPGLSVAHNFENQG